jgi:hypothetical protein
MGENFTSSAPGDGRLSKLLLLFAVIVAAGISTVWEHVRAVRAGYRLHGLEIQREKLREEHRRLEVKLAREERLETLEGRARKLGLPIPGEAAEIDGD